MTTSTPARHRRSPKLKLAAASVAMAVAASALASTAPAGAINGERTGPRDGRGFPTYYTDNSGISLRLCEDGTFPCAGAVRGDLVPPLGEALYWSATATLPTRLGELSVEFALEAAFGDAREPLVFDRLRVRGHLSRAGTYILAHPYGQTRIVAASPTEQRNVNFTEDLPCSLTGGCAGRITNWLRSTTPTVGYLSGTLVFTPVTGGTVRNSLALVQNGKVLGSTNQFGVLGKVAPGPAAALSAHSLNFGNTARTQQRAVVIRNLGTANLTLGSLAIAGTSTVSLASTSTCAAATTVAPGATCRAVVQYRPDSRRAASAALVIDDNTIAGSHRVSVRATTTPILAVPARVRFGARGVGRSTRIRRVLVENRGVIPLLIRSVVIDGRNERSFLRHRGTGPLCAKGASVRPGRACAIYLSFRPGSFGAKTADLRIRSNATPSLRVVRLTGRGR